MWKALAAVLFALGILWQYWRISLNDGKASQISSVAESVVGAVLFTVAALLALKEAELLTSFWLALPLFLIYLLFVDVAYSALRFHNEDLVQR